MKERTSILETIELLKSISQFIGEARANLCAPYGLTPIQSIILLDIYHHPDHTKITDICKRLNKTTNTISPLVNRLVEKGYLLKHQNKVDNRVFEVFFSSLGKDIMEKINKDVFAFAAPIFNEVSDKDYESLYNSLKALNKACGIL